MSCSRAFHDLLKASPVAFRASVKRALPWLRRGAPVKTTDFDSYLLRGEPGGAGGDIDPDTWWDEHPACEACGSMLCNESDEPCEGGCCNGGAVVGFRYDGHDFCEGKCADDTRAQLAEDIAREAAHVRGEVCIVAGCCECAAVLDLATGRRASLCQMTAWVSQCVRSADHIGPCCARPDGHAGECGDVS